MVLKALFALVASAAFSVVFNVRGKNILLAGLGGGIGYFLYLLALPMGGFFAVMLASAALALFAEVAARLRKAPATLFLVAGIVPIVPGGKLFSGVLQALQGDGAAALSLCGGALMEAGAIAVGIILVSSLLGLRQERTQ